MSAVAKRPPSSRPRLMLHPHEAGTEGVQRLREILKRQTFGAVAKRLRCDERDVRRWAREECRPSRLLRMRAEEVLSIPAESWDEDRS